MGQQDPTLKAKGSSIRNLTWAVEMEVVRQLPNLGYDATLFPTLNLGWSAHIPGALRGEALRIAQSLIARGHKAGYFVGDRAYPNGRAEECAIPLRLLGYRLLFGFKRNELGVGALDPRGFVQISGSWFLDSVPTVLRDADLVFADAAEVFFGIHKGYVDSVTPSPEVKAAYELARKTHNDAEALYRRQYDQRNKYRLKPKGRMADNGDRRYLIPTDAPGYATWKAKPGTHQGSTVSMKLPTAEEFAKNPNAGGLKRELHDPWGSPEWREGTGQRNRIESLNANIKRPQFEGLGDPATRAVRGNTFTYLVSALALVSENLRTMINFFKQHLTLKNLTAKNNKIGAIFWQAEYDTPATGHGVEPPD